MGTDQTAELSDAGYQFLIDLFNRHDKVRRSPTAKRIVFHTCTCILSHQVTHYNDEGQCIECLNPKHLYLLFFPSYIG